MMNETVTCMICGKEFATRITPSHLKTHNISMSEYKENYPNSQLVTAACAKNSCITLQNQINKYGLEEGTKRFNEIILSRNKIKYASSILATKIINLILSHLPENIAANAKCLQTEFFIHRNNKLYFYDLTFPKYKKIIEINGDYWHANPILYHHDDIINFPNKIKKASDVWEYDFNKMKHVIDYGFDIKYIWEYDFNKNTNQTINEVVKWILN